MPLAHLSLLMTVTPGGLGVFEGSWLAAFSMLGISAAEVGLFLLAQRLLVIVYSMVLAAPVATVLIAGRLSSSDQQA
jgi:uncharacterized membrane protein YbhN (UPF0104 family)